MDKFEGLRTGTLVKRSRHWHETRSGSYKDQLGIVVGMEYYHQDDDPKKGLVTWPIVHWEGAVMGSLSHPDNVDYYRRKR